MDMFTICNIPSMHFFNRLIFKSIHSSNSYSIHLLTFSYFLAFEAVFNVLGAQISCDVAGPGPGVRS